MLCSLSGCDKLSRPGAALGLATLTQLVDLDLSYIGATPPDDEDVETARELQAGLNGIGYSTWVRFHCTVRLGPGPLTLTFLRGWWLLRSPL